jgi:tagaturonate reductase
MSGSDTILQFGTGRFLRSFVDLFVDESNATRASNSRVIAVQSTGADRARQIAKGPFHVAVRGMSGGERIDTISAVHSVTRGLAADTDWDLVLKVAEDPDFGLVVSNTTEAGLALDDADTDHPSVPRSYPAKLLSVLLFRFRSELPGPSILPCELVDRNGTILRDLVLEQAVRWGVESRIQSWLREGVTWCDTLVDRIVSAPPEDHPMLEEDPLLSVAEPFALWAIATEGPAPIDHPAIQTVKDVLPFSLRKVRILNGAHTALVERALGQFVTVREAMADTDTRSWLTALVHDELVPCVADRVEGAAAFADSVFERFENPFLDHRLEDIALHQADKVKVRLLPSYEDHRQKFGKPPTLLAQALERYL